MKWEDRYPLIVSSASKMILIFFITIVLQWVLQYYSRSVTEKYQHGVNCKDIDSIYTPEVQERKAVNSWKQFY
jgi:hypothetical protein